MLVIRMRKEVGEMCVSCWPSEISMMAWADGDVSFGLDDQLTVFSQTHAQGLSLLPFFSLAARSGQISPVRLNQSQTLFGSVLCLSDC